MAKCKVEYREPTFVLELNAAERKALLEVLAVRVAEKHGDSSTLRDLTNIRTALRGSEVTDHG